jgi:hypothetical protein
MARRRSAAAVQKKAPGSGTALRPCLPGTRLAASRPARTGHLPCRGSRRPRAAGPPAAAIPGVTEPRGPHASLAPLHHPPRENPYGTTLRANRSPAPRPSPPGAFLPAETLMPPRFRRHPPRVKPPLRDSPGASLPAETLMPPRFRRHPPRVKPPLRDSPGASLPAETLMTPRSGRINPAPRRPPWRVRHPRQEPGSGGAQVVPAVPPGRGPAGGSPSARPCRRFGLRRRGRPRRGRARPGDPPGGGPARRR